MSRRKKRQDGLFQKTFRVTICGVRKQFCVYGHTEKELSEKERAKRAEIESGILKQYNPTVTAFFDRWYERRIGTVTEATLRMNNKFFGILKKITIPNLSNICFGDMRIKDVDIEVLRSVQNALSETRSSQTVNDYVAFLRHLFSSALKERVIDYDPTVLLTNLKRTEDLARNTNHRALNSDEIKAFFECDRYKSSPYRNLYKLAILTGGRCGELCAIRLGDISDGFIHINKTLTRTESGAYRISDTTKTPAGRRDIPVNERIQQVIDDQISLNSVLYGNVVSINDLLFKAVEGGLLSATPVDRELKRICKAAGIKPFTMHAFRATFATLLATEQSVPVATLMSLLGHTRYQVSLQYYIHSLDESKKKAMDDISIVI